MFPPRSATVLSSIARQYITWAVPVSSASVVEDCGLEVSSATIRNEMVRLEESGYIIRPHHAAGSIPSDKGYRYYVSTLKDIELPLTEQRLISHLFHQVEQELEEWLSLAVTLIAQRVQNVAVVTKPKLPACQFKHLELVSLQDYLALVVLVLRGAKVRQKLVNFDQSMSQAGLTAIANKLNEAYSGLSSSEILATGRELSATEEQVTDCLLGMMKAEDERWYEEPYLYGLHFLLNQPEFNISQRMVSLVDLVEQRKLVEVMVPDELDYGVQVIIGKENKAEVIQDYSVVISRYGLPDEAVGTIGVVGPTRMPYARAISAIGYIAGMISTLVAELYGRELPVAGEQSIDYPAK